MAKQFRDIQATWSKARELGTLIASLSGKGRVSHLEIGSGPKGEDFEVPPHPTTVIKIEQEIDKLISNFEAALAAMKAAYTS